MSKNEYKIKERISLYKLVICFTLASLIGTWYEELITIFKYGEWESRRGVVFGPFNPLYGFAFVVVIVLFHKVKSPVKVFIYGGLFGAAFEYFLGLAQEVLLGSRSWSYEGQFMNIQGRTSPIYAIIWGVFAVVFVKVIYPYLSNIIEMIPKRQLLVLSRILIVFFAVNIFITGGILFRYNMKQKGIEPMTPIGTYYDEHYGEDYITEVFPDMVFID